MATNYTTNYQLNQWEPTDQVLRTDFNADNAKLDAALAGLDSGKADGAALEALSTQVAGLSGRTAALETAAAGFGNCRIFTGSYTGNGAESHSHTFPLPPLAVFFAGPRFQMIALKQNSTAFSMEGGNYWGASAVWSGNTLTLRYQGDLGGGDSKIGNESGKTYCMVALMAAGQ